MRMNVTMLLALIALACPALAAGREQAEWTAQDSAKWDFERALAWWQDGHYGGLLYYYDGGGPLGKQWRESMYVRGASDPRPEEWNVTSVECESGVRCKVSAIVKFTDEEPGGLRRYAMVREAGAFWGLVDEQRLQCPEGYRPQYQGICFNIADEQAGEPDIEIRSAEPVAAD